MSRNATANSEKIQNYISHIQISRHIETDPAVSERLKKTGFIFNSEEFSTLLQTSKELHAVFYNKSIAVHLHTDGTTGHVSADLPTKTAAGTQVMPNVGLEPTAGKGIAPSPARFVSVPDRSSDASRTVTVSIPVPQEQYEHLAELTAKRMINPGVNYQVTALGQNNYNCIHYMHKHLQEAGITSGLNNLFPLEQLQKHPWAPILIPHIVNYSDEFKLQQFRIETSASDATWKNEADMIARKQRELAAQSELARKTQFDKAVAEFQKFTTETSTQAPIFKPKTETSAKPTVAQSRAENVYQHAVKQARDHALNPAYNPSATSLSYTTPSQPASYPARLQAASAATTATSHAAPIAPTPQNYFPQLQHSFQQYNAFGYDVFGRDRMGRHQDSMDYLGREKSKSSFLSSNCTMFSTSNSSSFSCSWENNSRSKIWDTYHAYVPLRFSTAFERQYGMTEYQFANMGYCSRLSFLRNCVDVTGLLSSYNTSVGYGQCQGMGLSEIGGVAAEVGILKGVRNSSIQALFDDQHLFAIKTRDGKMPFTDLQLQRIMRELYLAAEEEAPVFFSLHPNAAQTQFPVLHPMFQNTLVGEIIAYLDYWMKGFVCGATFKLDFIRNWHKTGNVFNPDKEALKKDLIDLKSYCQQHLPSGMHYMSLWEMMAEADLEEYWQKNFSGVSTRIISFVESVKGKDGVFDYAPKFRVEYTLEPTTEYKNELETYLATHGKYPDEYEQFDEICKKMASNIETQMPLLPMFRDHFEMLNIITQLSTHFKTLKTMGQMPDLKPLENCEPIETPKAFPSFPGRYYEPHPVTLSIKSIIDYFQNKVPAGQSNALDSAMMDTISQIIGSKDGGRWDQTGAVRVQIIEAIKQLLLPQLPADVAAVINTLSNPDLKKLVQVAMNLSLTQSKEQKKLLEMTQHALLETLPVNTRSIARIVSTKIAKPIIELEKQIVKIITEQTNGDTEDCLAMQVINIEATLRIANLLSDFNAQPTMQEKINFVRAKINAYEAAQLRLAVPTIPAELLALINNKTEANKTQLRAQYANQRANYNSQLSDIPTQVSAAKNTAYADIYRSVRAQINQFSGNTLTEHGIDLQLPLYQSQINTNISNTYASIDSNTESVRSRINSAISSSYTNESSQMQQIDQERLQTIRTLFSEMIKDCRDNLQKSSEDTKHLTRVVAKMEGYNIAVIKNYPVSVVGFKDNNNVVGGCGVEYRQLTLDTMTDTATFSAICDTPISHSEIFCPSSDGQYWVFSLKVSEHKFSFSKLNKAPEVERSESNTIDAFRQMLDRTPELITIEDQHGAIPLVYAAQNGNTDVVNLFLARRADVNHRLPNELTPLWVALQNRHETTALALIASPKINFHYALRNGTNYLHIAIHENLPGACAALIQKGVNLLQPRLADGITPWHLAVQKGDVESVKLMLAKGVDINAQMKTGLTALHIAAQSGNAEIIALLLAKNANAGIANKAGQLPLEMAIREHQEAAALLLASITRDQATQLLMLSGEKKLFSVGDVLIAKQNALPQKAAGSSADEKDYAYYLLKYNEKARLKKLNIRLPKINDQELIKKAIGKDDVEFLREWILSHDVIDPQLAYIAAENGKLRCLQLLLPQFTDAEIQNAFLINAAIRSGDIKVIEAVVPFCKNINQAINGQGETPLMLASALGDKKCVRHFLQCGANILCAVNGKTALHAAIANDDVDLLKLFSEITPVNEWPRNLGDYAVQCKKLRAEKWLKEQGISGAETLRELPKPPPSIEALLSAKLNPRQVEPLLRTLLTPQYSLLRAGIENENPIIMDLFIKHSFPSDARFDQGESKLHLAVRMNNIAFAKACLQQISVDSTADGNVTPLMIAAALGNARMVSLLLEQGANPDFRNSLQQTPLHCALMHEFDAIALQLILITKKLNIQDRDGNTALMIAAQTGSSKAVKLLLQSGAKWDVRNDKGLTALHCAALQGHKACVELLIENHRADINIKTSVDDPRSDIQDTALHFAAQHGHVAVCQLLMRAGADPLCENAMKITPMDLVFFGEDVGQVALFSKLPEFFNPKYQLNRLRVCTQSPNGGNANALRQLIAFDIDVTQVDEQGRNALHFAAFCDANLCAGILIDMGCSVDARDHEGNTPLHLAAKSGSVGVIALLIKSGAEINSVNHAGLTPLLIAIENNRHGALLKLIISGADLNQVSSLGISPAVLALSKNLSDIATMITLLSRHMLTERDFMGEHEKLFFVPVVMQWMQKITDIWHRSAGSDDTIAHLAVRVGSQDAIHVLAKGLPMLFSSRNAAGQTPQSLAAALKQTDAQSALAQHHDCEKIPCTLEAQNFWRVREPIQKTPEQIPDAAVQSDDALNAVGM